MDQKISSRRRFIFAAVGIAILLIAGGSVWWLRLATYHFAVVQDGVLYRDGNRGMREFATACRKGGIKTVVMLLDDSESQKEPFTSEAEFCRERGIKLVRISISAGERPKTADVRRFLDMVADSGGRPVLVHCAQGLRRTGMMVAAYQMSVQGLTAEQAKAAILPWGRKPERLDDIRGFIDDYDPAKREVGSAHVVTRPQDED